LAKKTGFMKGGRPQVQAKAKLAKKTSPRQDEPSEERSDKAPLEEYPSELREDRDEGTLLREPALIYI
jgi:hypothetical protein